MDEEASAMRTHLGFISVGILVVLTGGGWWTGSADAEERSYYSPIIHVDKEKGYIVISDSGRVFGVEVPPEAKPHLDKLPLLGLIDIVVEMRPDNPPLVKRWKLASGESSCKVFDGKSCK
jgi:hypothetical protein